MSNDLLRQLPSVDRLLNHLTLNNLITQYGRDLTLEALRVTLDGVREDVLAGELTSIPADASLIGAAEAQVQAWLAPTLRRVINATGVIVHTNLGRAPLADAALEALQGVAGGYSTLEFDLASGERGRRSVHAEALLRHITGAEAAFVVNNNAAATLLALTALAGPTPAHPGGRGVILSRSELVEIGGGFRMPDVMAQSGARLIEIGTTNRTHRRDYENAITEDAALVMRVHRSNFAIVGFTTEVAIAERVEVAHQYGLLFVDDLGSGALYDTAQFGLKPEPTVQASLAAGADLVLFSGDKLLGGPQAGILVGSAEVLAQIKRHPLARAIRPDKLCYAALTATLTHYLKDDALKHVPVWQMISAPLDELDDCARSWAEEIAAAGIAVEVVDAHSVVGGGSLPGESLPTRALAIAVPDPEATARRLRTFDPPVIVRREDDRLLVDPRTVLDRDADDLLAALKSL